MYTSKLIMMKINKVIFPLRFKTVTFNEVKNILIVPRIHTYNTIVDHSPKLGVTVKMKHRQIQ